MVLNLTHPAALARNYFDAGQTFGPKCAQLLGLYEEAAWRAAIAAKTAASDPTAKNVVLSVVAESVAKAFESALCAVEDSDVTPPKDAVTYLMDKDFSWLK